MSALARILKSHGKTVCGSDAVLTDLTDDLEKAGIEVRLDKCEEFVKACDVCVVNCAISSTHPDLVLAKNLGKQIMTRAELLGEIAKDKKCLSIAGTHGKTTTTGMLASVLLGAGLDPTIHIGGKLRQIDSNLHIGKGECFLTEACEYKDSFLSLHSFISVVLNVESDHLDYFKNYENLLNSFKKFAKNTKKDGFLLVNGRYKQYFSELNKNILTFGIDENDNFSARDIKEYKSGKFSFSLYVQGKFCCEIFLSAFGRHNVENALAVAGVSHLLGVPYKDIKRGLETFQGVGRRMELVRENSPTIIHDYAHHPSEIRATIEATKSLASKRIVIFQPHTFSRTRDLYNEFLTCFEGATEVWLLPIYPAREKPIKGISSKKLASQLSERGGKTRYFSSFESCRKEVENADKKALILVLGAGDIENLAKTF